MEANDGNDGKFTDSYHEPLYVGDIVICALTGQGNLKLVEREIVEISNDGGIFLKGMSKIRRLSEVFSTKPHREKHPEYYI